MYDYTICTGEGKLGPLKIVQLHPKKPHLTIQNKTMQTINQYAPK